MLLAAVIELEALEAGPLTDSSGDDIHGLWLNRWRHVEPAIGDLLHEGSQRRPYTLSPLMGLPAPDRRQVLIRPGDRAWFRVTTLGAELSRATLERWLQGLPPEISIDGLRWRVSQAAANSRAHAQSGLIDAQALADRHLLNTNPPDSWRLRFETATAFHGAYSHMPLPLPGSLLGSWWRRWQALDCVLLPDDVVEVLQDRLAISSFRLQTVPLRYGKRSLQDGRERISTRTFIGCVGDLTLRAIQMTVRERAVVDLLVAFSFWSGTGHHTAQGMGQTLPHAGHARRG